MENTLYIALSKQTALWRQLDMIANNLANVNTTGYKKASSHFTEYLSETKSDEALLSDRLSFVHDSGTVRDFSEGVFSPTGTPFDLALHGSAFFVVETNEGIRYTRNGQFKINDEGMLVTGNNDPVLDERNNPVFIAPQETEFNVTKDGVILTENGEIARLQTVEFEDMQKLRATHAGLYENMPGNPVHAAKPRIEQGMIEKSNVNAVVEMSEMIKVQRAYENIQMMIDTEHARRQNAMQVYAKSSS